MKHTRTAREQVERTLTIILRSRLFWRRAAIVFFVTASIAVPLSLRIPRKYQSAAVIMYRETFRSRDMAGGSEAGLETGRRLGLRLNDRLLSRSNLEPIIKEFNLFADIIERKSLVEAVDEMRGRVSFRPREGDAFEIAFIGSDPVTVQRVTARLAQSLVEEANQHRSQRATMLKEFLDQEADRNEVDLKEKEAALARFMTHHPQFGDGANVEAVLRQLAAPKVEGGSGGGELEARAARIERQLRGTTATDDKGSNPVAGRATGSRDSSELIEARRDLADKLSRYTDRHPDVVAARARVAAASGAASVHQPAAELAAPPTSTAVLDDAQRAELKDQLREINAQIAAKRAAKDEPEPASVVAEAETATARTVTLAVEFRRLQRAAVEALERQRGLDERNFRAQIVASSMADDRNTQVGVLDPAFRPTHPVSGRRQAVVGSALAVALALALATALLSSIFDDRIYDPDDLAVLDLLPLMGTIPRALRPGR